MSTFKVNIKDKVEYKQKDENKICKKLLVLSDESIYDNIKLFSNEKNYSLIEIKGKNLPHSLANKKLLRSIA